MACLEYVGVIFEAEGEPAAYALYREDEHEVYLRQFFVARHCRRQGLGTVAIDISADKFGLATRD